MRVFLTVISSVVIFMSACADPAANKPKAQLTEMANANAANAATAPKVDTDVFADFKAAGTELAIDQETSKVEFTGSKVTGKHDGGFKTFKGTIDLVGGKAEGSRVAFEIDMVSVFSDADGLTKHLQTGDFFEVEKHPKSSFVSTNIVPDKAAGNDNFNVTGYLEIRGVRRSVTFPATITVKADGAEVKSEFSINRKDFGIAYAGKADDLIRDDVVLRLDLKAAKK